MCKKVVCLMLAMAVATAIVWGQENSLSKAPFPTEGSSGNMKWKILAEASPRMLEAKLKAQELSCVTASIELTGVNLKEGAYQPEPSQGETLRGGNFITIVQENFEGAFPTGLWRVFDGDGTTNGEYYWGVTDYKYKSPTHSAWCARSGANGLTPPANYPSNCKSWMVYGPFNLSDANWAALYFSFWIDTESNYDWVYFAASTNGPNFCSTGLSGFAGETVWLDWIFNLRDVPNLGDVTGKSSVWIAFIFTSDGSVNKRGVYLDDIVLKKALLDTLQVVSSFTTPATSPAGLTWDGSYLWHSDYGTDKIYKLTTTGSVVSSFSAPDGSPDDLAWDGSYLWNADWSTDRIYKLTTSGSTVSSFTTPGAGPDGLTWDGSYLWNSDFGTLKIYKLTTTGTQVSSFSAPGPGPGGLAWDGTNLWHADWGTTIIYKLNPAGNLLDYFLSPGTSPDGLAWDGSYLWCADDADNKIYRLGLAFIQVTSPNGGENWQRGTSHDITWLSTGTSGNVRIELSIDGGSNWSTIIASTPDDGSYNWTIPSNQATSTNCYIRITDVDGTPSDQSNAPFTISSPEQITVTAPNGGETWYTGSSYNITWTSAGTSGNVKIDLSINGGSIWSTIIASTPDDGSYNWTIPSTQTPSTNCFIRISDVDGTPWDQSNGAFTISQQVPQDSLKVVDSSGAPGSTGNVVKISLSNSVEVGGVQFKLKDIPNWLTATGGDTTSRTQGFTISVQDNGIEANVLLFSLTGGTIAPGSGPIVKLLFDVSATATPGDSVILDIHDVIVSDRNGQRISPIFEKDGIFFLGQKGDVNGDGAVNILDIIITVNIIQGRHTPSPYEFWAADVNNDGKIDIRDVILIIRIIHPSASLSKGEMLSGQTAQISLPEVELAPGTRTELPLIADCDGAVAGLQLTIIYDPGQIKLSAPRLTERSQGMELAVNETVEDSDPVGKGQLAILLYSTTGKAIAAGSGPILNLSVEAEAEFEGASPLNLKNVVLANNLAEALSVEIASGSVTVAKAIPTNYELGQNYPNPFNPETTIKYGLPEKSQVTLKIFNLLGQEVRTLVDGEKEAGYHEVHWDGRDTLGKSVSAGIYLYTIQTGAFVQTRKMVILR
ncbi:MAG: dockerin type I domain-containing protein [candidate division KSB1 bacterium]|nr:dockerin type I domain-containing protein [candidate division KSB1 bacterium]